MGFARLYVGLSVVASLCVSALGDPPQQQKSPRMDDKLPGVPLVSASQPTFDINRQNIPGQYPPTWFENENHTTYICRVIGTGATPGTGHPTVPRRLPGMDPVPSYTYPDAQGNLIECVLNWRPDPPQLPSPVDLIGPPAGGGNPPPGWRPPQPVGPGSILPTLPGPERPPQVLPPEVGPDLVNHPIIEPPPDCSTALHAEGSWSEPWGAGNGEIVINGIGSPSGSALRADDIGGIASTDELGVLVGKGRMTEDVDDLVVQLPGRDFVLTRSFTGTSDFQDWAMWRFGVTDNGGWTFSTDTVAIETLSEVQLYPDLGSIPFGIPPAFQPDYVDPSVADDTWRRMGTVTVKTTPGRYTTVFHNLSKYRPRTVGGGFPGTPVDERREFETAAPSPTRMRAERMDDGVLNVTNIPVWVMTTPGGGTTVFFRRPVAGFDPNPPATTNGDSFPIGRIYKQIDEYGNVWTYRYGPGPEGETAVGPDTLRTIYLHGTEGNAIAAVDFYWDAHQPLSTTVVSSVPATVAHVKEVAVRRRAAGSSEWFRTHKISYTYLNEAKTQLTPVGGAAPTLAHLGHWDNDLVQVTFHTALNPPASVEGASMPATTDWKAAVTQYRYRSFPDSPSFRRQIATIIGPRQIEQIVAKVGMTGFDPRDNWPQCADPVTRSRYYLEAAALKLMALTDVEPLAGGLKLWHFYTKYAMYYEDPSQKSSFGRVGMVYSEPGVYGPTKCSLYIVPQSINRYEFTGSITLDPDGTGPLNGEVYSYFATVSETAKFMRDSAITTPPALPISVTGVMPPIEQWVPLSYTKTRTEDRPIIFYPTSNGANYLELLTLTADVTTVEAKTELNTDSHGAFSMPRRHWITKYVFDRFNRPAATYRPGAVRHASDADTFYQTTHLRDCELLVNDSMKGSVEGTTYFDESFSTGEPIHTDALRTQRPYGIYRGGQEYAEAVSATLYPIGGGLRLDLPTKSVTYLEAPTEGMSELKKLTSTTEYAFATPGIGGMTWPSSGIWPRLQGVLTSATQRTENDDGTGTIATSYAFDSAAPRLLKSIAKPDGTTTSYSYDSRNGRTVGVSVMKTPAGSGPPIGEKLETTAIYDLMGRRLAVRTANGETAAWAYGVAPLRAAMQGGGSNDVALPAFMTATPVEGGALAGEQVMYDCVVRTPQAVPATGGFAGPISVQWSDAEGGSLRTAAFVATGVDLLADGRIDLAQPTPVRGGQIVSRSESKIDVKGYVYESSSWVFPSSGGVFPAHHSETDNVLTTRFYRDGQGNLLRTEDPSGAWESTQFDAMDRPWSHRRGIGTSSEETGRTYFDGLGTLEDGSWSPLAGTGEGTPTVSLKYLAPGSGERDNRVERTWCDSRGRAILVRAGRLAGASFVGTGPYSLTQYDYAGRTVLSATVADTATVAQAYELATGVVDPLTSPLTIGVSTSSYTQRGLVNEAKRLANAPTQTSQAQWLKTRSWFDDAGRTVAVASAEGAIAKMEFDDLGRAKRQVTTVLPWSPAATWSDADWSKPDKGVHLEETLTDYHSNTTLAKLVTKKVRAHDDALTSTDGIGANAVTTYSAVVYDQALRPVIAVNYGTNDDLETNAFRKGTAAPLPLPFPWTGQVLPVDTKRALMVRTEFDARGAAWRTITRLGDASGTGAVERVTTTLSDGLGRGYAVIENHTGTGTVVDWSDVAGRWVVTWGAGKQTDQNRVTSTVFDKLGQTVKRVAHVCDGSTDGPSEVTEYVYAWPGVESGGGSDLPHPLPSNSTLYRVHFPGIGGAASSLPTDTVRYGYNAGGEQVAICDQNGTVRRSDRDGAGRLIADRVTTFGSQRDTEYSNPSKWDVGSTADCDFTSVDDTVKQIVTRYDRFGRVAAVISHGLSTVGGPVDQGNGLYGIDQPGVVNAVKYDYTVTGVISRMLEASDGPWDATVATAAYPRQREVRYEYTTVASPNDATSWRERLVRMFYPDLAAPNGVNPTADDTVVWYDYATGLDDRLNRASGLRLQCEGESASLASDLVRYRRLGVGTFAVTELPEIAVRMDRAVDSSNPYGRSEGGDGAGVYNGWDRFGRLRLNSWVADGYTGAAQTAAALWQEQYGYDLSGRRTLRHQVRSNASHVGLDWSFEYDRLDRLTTAWKGTRRKQEFARRASSQRWELDELGNWKSLTLDGNNDGVFTSATDSQTRRAHNGANELQSSGSQQNQAWNTTPTPANTRRTAYDGAGNMRAVRVGSSIDATGLVERLTVDAWNRLVKREQPVFGGPSAGGGVYQAEYRYNGLGWRVWERQLQFNDANSPVTDRRRWVYFSPSWQELVELEDRTPETGSDKPSVERVTQQFWGLRGVNDAVLRRCNATGATSGRNDYDDADDQLGGGSYYQLTDSLFSVIAHVRSRDGVVQCRFSYDSYGKVRAHLPGDFDGSGGVTSGDLDAFMLAYGNGDPEADFTGDGVVDADDESWFVKHHGNEIELDVNLDSVNAWGPAVPRVGFAGCTRDPVTGRWLSRNRWYDSELGRWVTRDPAGYADGLNMYLYVRCNPLALVDPTGLNPDGYDKMAAGMMKLRQEGHEGQRVLDNIAFAVTGTLALLPVLAVLPEAVAVGATAFGVAPEGAALIGSGVSVGVNGSLAAKAGYDAGKAANMLITGERPFDSGAPATPEEMHDAGVDFGVFAGFTVAGTFAPRFVGAGQGLRPPPLLEAPPASEPVAMPEAAVSGETGATPSSSTFKYSQTTVGPGSDSPMGPASMSITGPALDEPVSMPALRGTNVPGQLTSRSSFRVSTELRCWNEAPPGPNGGRLCPDCSKECLVKPNTGPRDWHIDHNVPWTKRLFSNPTRPQVIDNYQEDTKLLCPKCNLKKSDK